MRWVRSWRADPAVARLADRHYSRQSRGHQQFAGPGRIVVLRTLEEDAAWVTLWPEFFQHDVGPAWFCTLFRNESPHRSSELILEALAATRARFGDPPPEGVATWVDPAKVASPNPGYCFKAVGFQRIGTTKERGYHVLWLPARLVPPAQEPLERQLSLEVA